MITDAHLRHLVAMETDVPDSAADVDRMSDELNQFHLQSAVSCSHSFISHYTRLHCNECVSCRNNGHFIAYRSFLEENMPIVKT